MGCGDFGNDPNEIAELFRDALEGAYRSMFVTVVFAVFDRSLAHSSIGPFQQTFERYARAAD